MLLGIAGASFLLPGGLPLAAVDDAGMKYVSGGEGLGGSIRLNLNKVDTDLENPNATYFRDDDVQVNYGESRVYMVGDVELERGWQATYYFEIRPDEERANQQELSALGTPGSHGSGLFLESQDVGLRGPFGWFRIGRLESVSSALLPTADRTNDIGTSGSKLADYYDNGIRWTSPEFRGLRLGASLRMRDQTIQNIESFDDEAIVGLGRTNSLRSGSGPFNFQDKAIDEWDVALTYSLPQGLDVGFSVARKIEPDARDTDQSGFRVGASYVRNNWSVAYNFHRYQAYNPLGLRPGRPDQTQGAETNQSINAIRHYTEYNGSSTTVGSGELLPNGIETEDGYSSNAVLDLKDTIRLRGDRDTEYTEHVVGGNVLLGKFNAALNYSIANTANSRIDVSAEDGVQSLDYEVRSIRADLSYRLGSKSQMIAAWQSDKNGFNGLFDRKLYHLMYRVDF